MSSLPRLAGLQFLPSPDRTRLHTDHVLIPLLRRKIRHAARVRPGVPDDHLRQVVSCDTELRLTSLGNDDWCTGPASGSVDAVDLGGDGECRWRGLVGRNGGGELIDKR